MERKIRDMSEFSVGKRFTEHNVYEKSKRDFIVESVPYFEAIGKRPVWWMKMRYVDDEGGIVRSLGDLGVLPYPDDEGYNTGRYVTETKEACKEDPYPNISIRERDDSASIIIDEESLIPLSGEISSEVPARWVAYSDQGRLILNRDYSYVIGLIDGCLRLVVTKKKSDC